MGDAINGTITQPGGVDVYEYDGVGGEAIALYMYSGDGDSYLTIYDPDGNFLAQDDDSAGGLDAVVYATLPFSGVYFLEASMLADNVGSYDLVVDPAPPELIPGLGAFGQLDAGVLSTYWFQGSFDQDVVIEMYSDFGDSYVQLYDTRGSFFVDDDDTLETSEDAHLRVKLPADGPFFVDASFLSGSGSFELQLSEPPTNEVFFEETALGLIDPFGIHEYTYYGLVGEGLSVVMTSDFNGGEVELYSPSGAFIASGPPGNPSIALPLAEEGFYTLRVMSTDGTGIYSIFVSGAG